MTKLMHRKTCECGILLEYAQKPDFPLVKSSDGYFFTFDDKKEVKFCFFCGGYDLGPGNKEAYVCNCNIIEEWAKDSKTPVKYDKKYYEYFLEEKDGGTTIFYFCSLCGGKLPESTRDNFFSTPSTEEIEELELKIKNLNKIQQFIERLGKPDIDSNIEKANKKYEQFNKNEVTNRTLIFSSSFKTLNLIVQEDENGEIIYFFAGKPKT
jgi:hypothetical protein